jgi:hypothetical protein
MRKPQLLTACVALLLAASAFAQNSGDLRGSVHAEDGQPVVSAFVIAQDSQSAVIRAASTNEAGEFEIAALPVGEYSLQITAEGHPKFELHGVHLGIGQAVNLNLVLGLGNRRDQVDHSGKTGANIESANTQLGVVMDDTAVSKLPLKARDTYELLQLQPGVESTVGANLFYGSDQPGVVSVSGGRARSNVYNVNGTHGAELFVNAPAVQPSPDSIQEFRVISHNYDAELGKNSGSVLNVVTKSGTNNFHGTAYDFIRNDSLNARGYFDPQKNEFRQNDFGSTLGGPIRKDQTFFFASYEGRHVTKGVTSNVVAVPTAQERIGDFSAGPGFAGTLTDATVAQVLNARPGCAGAVAAAGGASIAANTPYASIFPNNTIPAQCFDPTANDLLASLIPPPNLGMNSYRTTANSDQRQDQGTLRFDHNFSSQQKLALYYYVADGYVLNPFSTFQGDGASIPGFGDQTASRFQQLSLFHSWAVNAKITNEARLAYFRQGQGKFQAPQVTHLVQDSCANVPSASCFTDPGNPELGITPGYGANREGTPFVNIAGGFTVGNNKNGSFSQGANVYEASDAFTRVLGQHTLKVGSDWRNERMTQVFAYNINGDIEFSGGGPNDVGYANLFPNYLLGLPDTYAQGSSNAQDVRTAQVAFFGQDSWRVRRNLSFNYGLRWELMTPQADAGKRIQAFRPGQASTLYPCQLDANNPLTTTFGGSDCSAQGPANAVFPLGLLFPGDSGVPAGLTNTYKKSFAPRLGLAWSPDWSSGPLAKLGGGPGRSSVRLGWGMFYDGVEELVQAQFTAQPPFGGSAFLSNPFFNTPFLSQDGTVNPNPFHGVLNPTPGTPVDFSMFRPIELFGNFPNILPSQYAEQYHLTLQREISQNTLLQLGYVGSQGHRLLAIMDQNPGNADTCLDLNLIPGQSCGPYGSDNSYTIPAGAIPAGVTLHLPYGPVPSVTGPNSSDITLVGLRPYSSPLCAPTTGAGCPPDGIPVFTSIFSMQPAAKSAYNSFQALVRHNYSHGLELLASYTWSKSVDNASSVEETLNPLNPASSKSLSLFDADHRAVVSYYWILPQFHGSPWARRILNGWSTSGIATFQSGFPIRITSTSDRELMGSIDYLAPGEPDLSAPLHILTPQRTGGLYFDPTGFTDAPLGQIGNAPRTICCGPGMFNFDLGLHRTLTICESRKLEFRGEAFNLFNHTQFLNPDGNITNTSTFGYVDRARDPRLLQAVVRFVF